MPYITRDNVGHIIGIFTAKQFEGQEFVEEPVNLFETYQQKRAKEYPNFHDYLDAIVKGDLAQQQAYIDACLAIKSKYPKPV